MAHLLNLIQNYIFTRDKNIVLFHRTPKSLISCSVTKNPLPQNGNILDIMHYLIKRFSKKVDFITTRGIWKVLSMVFYLSNQFTNPIMFGIILKNYLSSLI